MMPSSWWKLSSIISSRAWSRARPEDLLTGRFSDDVVAILSPCLLVLAFLAGAIGGWLASRGLNRVLSMLFGGFNRGFGKATAGYVRTVGGLLRFSAVVPLLYG